jgi:hypothetical protein
MLVWDSVIFSFTLYKAFTIGRGIPLLDVIVRDGASSSMKTYARRLISHHRGLVLLVCAVLAVFDKIFDNPLKCTLYCEFRKYFGALGRSTFRLPSY